MARSARGPRRISSRQFRSSPYPLRPFCRGLLEKENHSKKTSKAVEKETDWEDATCSVCMEFPHNAVLLLCSSHDKGCRPYMCGTSYRYSNCLDLYKKAYTRVLSPRGTVPAWPPSNDRPEATELSCPLCRGQVKGWTVVETAREYLNSKRRSCMQDNCLFVGSYRELRKHVRAAHPSAKPREVDPTLEQKWRRLEREREHEDVISVIRSSTPGAVVWGDYVIEGGGGSSGSSSDNEEGGGDVVVDRDRSRRGGIRGFDPSILYVLSLVRAFQNSRNAGHGSSRSRTAERGGVHRLPVPVNGGGGGGSFGWGDGDFIVDVDDDDDDDVDPVLRPVRSARASVWDDDADDGGGGGGVDGVAVVGGEGRGGAGRSERRRRRRHRSRGGAQLLEGDVE